MLFIVKVAPVPWSLYYLLVLNVISFNESGINPYSGFIEVFSVEEFVI